MPALTLQDVLSSLSVGDYQSTTPSFIKTNSVSQSRLVVAQYQRMAIDIGTLEKIEFYIQRVVIAKFPLTFLS